MSRPVRQPIRDWLFQCGDRVRLNQVGLRFFPKYADRKGTVVIRPRQKNTIAVHWDGAKAPTRWAYSFFELVREDAP